MALRYLPGPQLAAYYIAGPRPHVDDEGECSAPFGGWSRGPFHRTRRSGLGVGGARNPGTIAR